MTRDDAVINAVTRHLIDDVEHFSQAYGDFLRDRNSTRFWRDIGRIDEFDGLERLAADRLSPNALLFRMIEVAKQQENSSAYHRLLPLYRQTVR